MNGSVAPQTMRFCWERNLWLGRFLCMKQTTRKPLHRMIAFVAFIFAVAVVIAAIYIYGFTPGEAG